MNLRKRSIIYVSICFFIITIAYIGLNALEKYENRKVIVVTSPGLTLAEEIMVGETRFSVEKVDTIEERARGLSGIKSIKENNGLLFVFDRVGTHGIWMKEMFFSIDVMWFDKEGNIIFIKENFSPSSYPEVVYPPEEALYILEVKAGMVEKHQIKIGDRLKIL